MKRHITIALISSVLLAVGAPLGNAFLMAEKFRTYPSFRVDIAPYDPRDLFYGHYLRFSIDWNWKEKMPEDPALRFSNGNGEHKQCLCVSDGDLNPVVEVRDCPAEKTTVQECRYVLKGESYNPWNFDNGVDRYYLSETVAKPLEMLFIKEGKKFSLDLHVTPDGKSLPGNLYIDNVPLKEFLARNGNKVPGVIVEEQ